MVFFFLLLNLTHWLTEVNYSMTYFNNWLCNYSYFISFVNNSSGKNILLLLNLAHPSNSFSINLFSQTLSQDQKCKSVTADLHLWTGPCQVLPARSRSSRPPQTAERAGPGSSLHFWTAPPWWRPEKSTYDSNTQSRKTVVWPHQIQVRLCGYEKVTRNPEQDA